VGRSVDSLLRGRRVLIVEDEALILFMLEDMLSDLGAEVAAQATTVPQGMALATRGGFDVAILDLNLGGMKVFPVAEVLRTQGLPFVFASGYGASGVPAEFAGHPVVAKPYQIGDLAAALSRALADPERGPANVGG
jgi:CheY-like chemotaxis protein